MKTLTGSLSKITSLLALTVSACAFPLSEEGTSSAILPVSAHPQPSSHEGFAPDYESASTEPSSEVSRPTPNETPGSEMGAVTQNEGETATSSPVSSQPQSSDSNESSSGARAQFAGANTFPNPQLTRADVNLELSVQTISSGFEIQFVPHSPVHVGSGALHAPRIAGVGEILQDSLCPEGQAISGRIGDALECKMLDENTSGEWITGIQAQTHGVSGWTFVKSEATASVFKLGSQITGVRLELSTLESVTEHSSVCGLRELAVGIRKTYGRRIVQNRAQRFLKKTEVLCKEAKAVLSSDDDSQAASLELDLSRERIGPREIQPPIPSVYPSSLNPPLPPRF